MGSFAHVISVVSNPGVTGDGGNWLRGLSGRNNWQGIHWPRTTPSHSWSGLSVLIVSAMRALGQWEDQGAGAINPL